MKIQLAKLSRQLTAHGRNGSSSAMVLKTTPLRQLLQGFSCALLLLLPLHSPPTSTHPATLPTQEQGKIRLGNATIQHQIRGNPTAGLPAEHLWVSLEVSLWSILLHHLVYRRFNLLAALLKEGKKLSGEAIICPSSHHSAAK